MATNTNPVAAVSGFELYLPAIEQGVNIALLALGTAGVVPGGPLAVQIAAPLESALNSLIASIKSKSVSAATYLSVLGAELDVLKALKAVPGISTDVITKIDQYTIAVEGAIAGYMQAQKGFDPSQYTQVQPIS